MWALRVLSGAGAGTTHPLKMGRNLIGRGPTCDVKIISNGVSKEHCEVHVYKDKILVVDLRSSNGTYINGIKIQNNILRLGDKMSVHDVLLDVVPAQDRATQTPIAHAPVVHQGYAHQGHSMPPAQMPPGYPPMPPGYGAAAPAYAMYPQGAPMPPQGSMPAPAPAYNPNQGLLKNLGAQVQDYMDRVALPGVYKLPSWLEFRYVLGSFVVIFIFATTLLSMIPMVAITRASIVNESKRRAQSLARTLAMANQQALIQGAYASLNTHQVETEDGVKQALIVQQSDGVVLSPASMAGNSPDLPFVVTARKEMKTTVAEIDPVTIGASWPIGLYDPTTGDPIVKAHAIILYDIGSLAFDDGRALSLFLQTLVLASLLGLALFYFMYKLVEYPFTILNQQLDTAMREKKDNIELHFLFPALQAFIANLNSLLNRYINGDAEGGGDGGSFANKDTEASNLLHLIGYPAIAIRGDASIISCNNGFEQLARNTAANMANQPLSSIPDAALQQNIDHLIAKAREVPHSIHNDQLEFSGHLCSLSCQAFVTAEVVDYYIVSIAPVEGG